MSPTLARADQAEIEREGGWAAPPTIRMAQLAEALVRQVHDIPIAERLAVLSTLEQFLSDGTQAEGDVVTTGFLEELLSLSDRGFDLDLVWNDLGPKSQAYCRAWNDFGGVENTR
ncbi:MAG: hypothetical protein ABIS21_08410 [Acidimicrobiales bacterium]